MTMNSHLDALSPGMRAKLDPLFRISREQGVSWPSTVRNEADSAPHRHNLGTVERYRRHQESRIKIAGF